MAIPSTRESQKENEKKQQSTMHQEDGPAFLEGIFKNLNALCLQADKFLISQPIGESSLWLQNNNSKIIIIIIIMLNLWNIYCVPDVELNP